ncbi:MAG: MotA/TolQ/ExbB proton channel family protein [Phycisphaerales bacterium]|nr:MotA/TolQ/ExbB proton channel family protein [Phycisphaerales bacterium]
MTTGQAAYSWAAVLAQEAEPAAAKSLWQYIRSGGPIGMVIILLSVVAVALVVLHLIRVRRERMLPEALVLELDRLLQANDVKGATEACRSEVNDSFLARVIGSALERCSRSPFGFLELRSALEEAGQRETDRLYRSTDGIGLIAALGPMLGLLGTVVGMIGAFGTIGDSEASARSQQLAGYMAIALVTTAEGLLVAIPCTAAFTIFRRRIDRLVGEAGEVVELLASRLETTGERPAERGGEGRAPARPAPAPRPAEAGKGARAT